jgi:hypothetical protein
MTSTTEKWGRLCFQALEQARNKENRFDLIEDKGLKT